MHPDAHGIVVGGLFNGSTRALRNRSQFGQALDRLQPNAGFGIALGDFGQGGDDLGKHGSNCLNSSAAEERLCSSASARSVAIKAGTRSAGFAFAFLLKIPAEPAPGN